jgi:hypothetical protein
MVKVITEPIQVQLKFTTEEAMAICDMIARIVNEGYDITISQGKAKKDEEGYFYPYNVEIPYSTHEGVATSEFRLIDALTEAWEQVPERRH